MISVTAFGRVPKGSMVRRAGAMVGDLVVVTGTIGDAALGLDLLTGGKMARSGALDEAQSAELISRYRVPQPRNRLALAVRQGASAAMDVSDGLAGDLEKLCAVSGVAADVELARIPLSSPAAAALAAGFVSFESLIAGGDDYEVLCTVVRKAADGAGIPVSVIGRVGDRGSGVRFLDQKGSETKLSQRSYSHF